MIDIDFFKDFNDAHGHQVGDQCLRRVAHGDPRGPDAAGRPADALRRGGVRRDPALDTPPRAPRPWPRCSGRASKPMATRHPKAPLGVVTISLGVATAEPGGGSSPEMLVAAADEALYRAKRAGKNRVEAAEGVRMAGWPTG